jgi:hypothetical protein
MTHTLYFNYATVTTAGVWARHAQRLQGELPAALGEGRLYAGFAPQFGLSSDQLVVMTCWDAPDGVGTRVESGLLAVDGVEQVEQHMMVPTARPRSAKPPTRKGLYVHRWFDLEPRHVDEIVEMSAVAWETFERTFEVEVIGFFRSLDGNAEQTRLMLLNWYPSLAAWETSRDFDADPASRDRFLRRAALTQRTWAITTSLAW